MIQTHQVAKKKKKKNSHQSRQEMLRHNLTINSSTSMTTHNQVETQNSKLLPEE